MRTVNMHEAKTQLSRLVADAAAGEPFIIARAGTPLVQVSAVKPPPPKSRLGFLAGEFDVPDDFDTIGSDEIQAMFEATRKREPDGEVAEPEES